MRQGHADTIGMTRSHIADLQIVEKLISRNHSDIRPCVGANPCVSQAAEAKPLKCFYNLDVGEE